jgi:DNA-binding transcriptional MerR regulator
MSGWIKIHRKFLDWEWFNKSEAVHLFMYLVLKANYKDGQWQGIDIKKGQFVTSFGKISADTGISLQTIRTLFKKFEKSNEINIQTTNKYSVVTICKYECYQKETEETNEQLTNKQQSTNNQLTTNKNDKKEKKEIYIPELSEFLAFAIQECSNINQDDVKHKYKSWVMNEWKDGNDKPIKNWKTKLLNTIPHLKKHEIQKERTIID